MKRGRRRKKSMTVNLRKKPDESGGTKKNLEARLPTAPLGIETRLLLLRSCLSNVSLYMMSTYDLPKGPEKRLNFFKKYFLGKRVRLNFDQTSSILVSVQA